MNMSDQTKKMALNKLLTSAALAAGLGCLTTVSWADVIKQTQTEQEVGITQEELNSIEVLSSRGEERGKKRDDPKLNQIDQDQDAGLVWSEIYAIYDDELDDAGWTSDYVFAEYDENDDNVLNEEEYMEFLAGLKAQTVANTQANPPAPSELDTTAGMVVRENELPGTVDAREEQMRIYGPGEEPAETIPTEEITNDLREQNIQGREVVNYNREEVGEVEDVVFAPDGSISGLVVGVGGFWGIGEKDVFVPADELKVYGNQIVWETLFNEEQLDDMQQYELEQYSLGNP